MLLVTLIVSLFMFNWRTTLIVSIIIPLSLLFAFICLHLMGMSANLLSLGAIDFGIIIDGAVIMVEGLFVQLDKKAHEVGMERFNQLSKLGMIRKRGAELAKAIFFTKLIIITALLPIFSFQKVEGKMFSPLAYTLGFAAGRADLYADAGAGTGQCAAAKECKGEAQSHHTLHDGIDHARFPFRLPPQTASLAVAADRCRSRIVLLSFSRFGIPARTE
jgi:hypothetical protein